MDSLYAAIPIAPPAPLGERNIEAFILPLVIDEVSYVLMVQTARRTGSPNDARSI